MFAPHSSIRASGVGGRGGALFGRGHRMRTAAAAVVLAATVALLAWTQAAGWRARGGGAGE